ncbi:apolipoprotein N-acyltransferase [Elusimicrobium simillimum]|uniref:apolipoprotein N-acyltransferase n=1 Tax=Elusimicrobium simillimum TaxID=3143438 RepID=UPI003C6FE1C3
MAEKKRKTGQYVVRQRDTQVYSYISNKRDIHKHKENSSFFADKLAIMGRLLLFIFAAALSAYLVFLSFPKQSHSIVAWVSLVPLFVGIRKTRGLFGSVFFSWLTGAFTCVGLFYWIYYTAMAAGVTNVMSIGACVVLSVSVSAQFALFGGLCFYARKYNYFYPLLVATGWVSLELLHQVVAQGFIGFPWFMLGYSQWNNTVMLQVASIGGVYAVSFAIAFVNGSIATAFTMKSFGERALAIFFGAIVFSLVFTYGKDRLAKADAQLGAPTKVLKVSILQPNIDQYKKWNSAFVNEIENKLKEQLAQITPTNPDIIVWPETALPGPAQEARYYNWLEDISKKSNAYQIIGSTYTVDDVSFVSAYMFDRAGGLQGIYNKEQLVPFGEYIPFEDYLSTLDIEVLGALGSFTPGDRNQPLQKLDDTEIGINICYESVFPAIWRKTELKGAKIFFNITNDGWYLDTSAPYQHFAINVMRAAELGVPVVRSANTGISGWIDGFGRIRESSTLNTDTVMNFSVPLHEKQDATFYAKWGNLFVYICIFIFLNIAFTAFIVSDE